MQQMDDPPYLSVGTEVSAKYKGAFCEAKVRKVVRNIKCKVAYKQGLGSGTVSDDQIKGDSLRVGSTVEVKHPERREFVEATITKIQDCSQYTVVFDDGDITTLRRSALCLKSGRHFNESETLDQLPLTHPEHFGNPVMGGRRGARRSRPLQEDSSDDDDDQETKEILHEKEEHIGKVVCVENSDTNKKKAPKENWFPGLVVAPQAQDTVRIRVKDEYLVRSFKDGRYYTVPKKEATEFTRAAASKQEGTAVQAALEYLDRSVLPPHWDRDVLFGLSAVLSDFEQEDDSESSDDEPREEKDHFVAQLYKYMDDRGTPLNKGPSIINRDVDLYRLCRTVQKLGGYNRVTTSNQWKSVATRLGFAPATTSITNLVKQAYKKFVQPFEDFNRKLGCTMVAHPRANRIKGRSLVRANSVASPKPSDSKESGKPSTSSSITADESENNSESETDEPVVTPPTPSPVKEKIKRKLSAGTSGIKVKTLVDKYEEKIITKDSKESSPDIEEPPPPPIVDIVRSSVTPPTSRPIVIPVRRAITPPTVSRPIIPITTPTSSTKLFKSVNPVKEEKEIKESVVVVVGTSGPPSSSSSSYSSSGPPILPIMRNQKIPKRPDEKRGRKKKDNDEKDEKSEKKEGEVGDFPIDVGDKLKVYYHAQKVTYEAKVIEISVQSGTPVYLVHYTGWNTRYDEWVPKERIAGNLTNSKTKRSKPGTPKSASNSANTSTTTPGSSKSSSKRGRGNSRSDSQPPRPRSTTPSSVASNSSRTKSPATPAQRRTTRGQTGVTRRTSNNTDISSILTESDTDSDEPVISKKSANRTNSTVSTSSSSSNTSSGKEKNTSGNGRGPNLSDDGGPSSKGRDYDLNQIRSELKGFKKLKSPSPETDIPLSTSTDESDRKSIFDSPDNKRLLQLDLKKGGGGGGGDDTSDAKTSSDVSSETDSTADDDSQSSTKAVGKTDKVLPFNKFDKTKSQILEKTPVKNLLPERIIPRKISTNEPTTTIAKTIEKVSKVIEKESEKISEMKLLKEKEIENEKIKEREREKERETEKEKEKERDIEKQKEREKEIEKEKEKEKERTKAALHEKKMERAAAKVDKKTIAAEKSFSRMNISEKIKATDKIKIIEKIEIIQKTQPSISTPVVAVSTPPPPMVTTTVPIVTTTTTITATTPVKDIKKPLPIIEDDSSLLGDIYEFKEPEPFEFEVAPPSKTKASTLLENEKKAKKQLLEMSQDVLVKPIIPVTKRVKKSPIKEPPEKIIKLIKKEDPIVEEISSLPMIPSTPRSSSSADLFDVLRKSPNFNMNANSSSDLSPIDCKTNIFTDEKFQYPDMGKNPIKIQPIVLDFTKADPPKLFEPISSIKDEMRLKDDFKEMEVVQRILSPQPLVDIEAPKPQDKPSIADKVLKALTQQSQSAAAAAQLPVQQLKLKIEPIEIPKIIENLPPPIPEIKPIEALVLSPIITTPPPKIELSAIVKKDLEISIKKNVFNSPEHDILESISPKNNDLSETIQKLESVIQKTKNIDSFAEDSTDSTDSEQRLVIEDESQSSETNVTQQEFICINKKESDANYGTRRDLSKEKNFTKALENVKDDLNFVSKFQENLFGIQRPIDKQQMIAVEFLTTGMIEAELKSERLHKEKMEIFDNAQTQHILHNESLSMLLCEETIPESPAPSSCYSNVSSSKEIKDLEHMKKVMDGLNFINTHPIGADIKPVPMEIENDLRKIVEKEIVAVGTPQSSPSNNSISQDDSKSDSEDLKKQENEKDPSPMKRRRQRKTSEGESNLKRRKTQQFRKSNTTNGTDSEDNSDPVNIRTATGPRTPKPCQYNFLVNLDTAMTSNYRITLLKKKIQELRKTYNMIKVELASIDRRRKKLRRREREKNKLAKAATS